MTLQPHPTPDPKRPYAGERTPWGWRRWSSPTPDGAPQRLLQIGIRTPEPSLRARCAQRWLTRRPPIRLYLDHGGSVTGVTLLTAVVALLAMPWLMSHGVPVSIALPLVILLPLLVDHLPTHLDSRARRYARVIDADPELQYLQRRVAQHQCIVRAAESSSLPEFDYALQLGHRVLWEIALLATAPDPNPDSECSLLPCESLLTELARQAADAHSAQRALDAPRTPPRGRPVEDIDGPASNAHPDHVPAGALTETAIELGHIAAARRYATRQLRSIDTPTAQGSAIRPDTAS